MHKETLQMKAIGCILTAVESVDISKPLPVLLLSTRDSIIQKNKPLRDRWRNSARCDNTAVRCPLLADRAYNEVKMEKTLD